MTASAGTSGGGRAIPWRLIGWGIAAFLLLLPLVTNAPWTASDYVFMGVLFGLVGLGIELAVRRGNAAFTMGAALAIAASFLLIWINAAVGIIGSEQEDANLLFLGVVALALLGSAAALFRPAGMVVAMAAAAVAQLLVPPAAWLLWPDARAALWQPEVIVLTGFFAGMWVASAWLFRKAAGQQ